MSFRPPRTLPIITLFHNAKSSQSRAALNLLQSKQKNHEGDERYRIDVMDESKQPPTSTQLGQVASFLNSNTAWKDMLIPDASQVVDNAKDAFNLVISKPTLIKCPIVVDWEKGSAALGADDLKAIEELIDKRK
ncbi:hypothetical protein BY458DRAFT_517087 [Sporodiniella umbellata]|nr:hypothetical protein BY458DRAFT_517087 [Sporodiniella umbellata]